MLHQQVFEHDDKYSSEHTEGSALQAHYKEFCFDDEVSGGKWIHHLVSLIVLSVLLPNKGR